jgi:hypothetical protein
MSEIKSNNASTLDAFDKDAEIQTVGSDSQDLEKQDDEERDTDIEAGSNEPQQQIWSAISHRNNHIGPEELDAVTRTSTKSSWKDPGPPPDGGWEGWTQGELLIQGLSTG